MADDVRDFDNFPPAASTEAAEEDAVLAGYSADDELGSRAKAAILKSRQLIEQSQDLSRQCNELHNSLRR